MPMRSIALLIGLATGMSAVVWLPAPAAAQTASPGAAQTQPGTAPEPAQKGADKGVLSTEERKLARRAAREDATVQPWSPEGSADGGEAASRPQALVGEPLPPELPARRAPQSLVSKLPSRPQHEYWIFGNNLALVDKESREVSDIVRDLFEAGSEDEDVRGSGTR